VTHLYTQLYTVRLLEVKIKCMLYTARMSADGHAIEALITYHEAHHSVGADFFWPNEPVVEHPYTARFTPGGHICLDDSIPARPDAFTIHPEAALKQKLYIAELFGKDILEATLEMGQDQNGIILVRGRLELSNRLHLAHTQLRHSKAPMRLKRACQIMIEENKEFPRPAAA